MALKENPIHLREDNQIATGWIDLIWQTLEGCVIVDHKSHLGQVDTVQKHCIAFVAQLNVHADCMAKALGSKPLAQLGHLPHLPMTGLMVEIGKREKTCQGKDSG